MEKSRMLATWVGGLALAIGGLASHAQGQGVFSQRGSEPEDVFLLAPRPLVRLLREGERALEEGRYTDGIAALGALLQDDTEDLPADLRGQDFFIERGRRGLYSKTVKGEAMRLLAGLPTEGRKVLEIEFGVAARRELERGVAEQDFAIIASVARRFAHTQAGYDAQILIARQKLTDGFPLAAASIFQGLLDYPAARQRYGVGLAKAAAICWKHAGQPTTAAETLKLAARDFPGSSIELAGRQIPLEADTDWDSIVAGSMPEQYGDHSASIAENWLVSGGGPSRNAVSDAGMPLANARWVKEIHSSVPEKEALLKLAETERQGERVILPKFEVRMLGDLLLTKTTDSEVLAIDFETGLTKWPVYHNSAPTKLSSFRFEATSSGARSELSQQLQTRVWGSSSFGRFSCDAERLYYITTDRQQTLNSRRALAVGQSNRLQGVSIAGQGKILWQIGGAGAASLGQTQVDDMYFLGPPLSYEGDLYVLVEKNGETELLVLDPATGQRRWSQQLIHPLYRPLRFDPARRSQAISPTISDGVVLCPTGAGAVVAVDLLTRSLRWGMAYNPNAGANSSQFLRQNAFGAFGGVDFNPLAARWQDNGMIAQDGIVVISPPEADTFFCRKVLTGEPVLPPQGRSGGRYVAGLYQGNILVVAEQHVYCINLREQSVQWEQEFPDRRKLAGKGLWLADSLIVPLTGKKLIEYDLATGEVRSEATVDQPLGNLFAHRGNLISVSPVSVAVYHTREHLTSRVAQRLAEDPEDTWALNQSSQLAFAGGDLEEAYRLLSRSYEIDASSSDTRYLLIETLLAGLAADFKKYQSRARAVQEIVEYGPQRFRFLQWLALGGIREGQHLPAFETLLELMRERVGTSYSSSQSRARELRLSELHIVDTDNWIATALARLYGDASAEDRQAMDRRIAEELASVEGVVIPLRHQKLKYFLWHPSAESQVLSTAISMLERDDQTRGEQLLQPLLHSGSSEIRETAAKLLARRTIRDNELFGPRGRAYSSVFDSVPNKLKAIIEDAETSDALMSPVRWKEGAFRAVEVVEEQRLYPTGMRLPQISQRYGRPDIDIRLHGTSVVISNTSGEDVAHLDYNRASADNNDEFTKATVRGGLLIIETSSEVVGMDLYRGLNNGRDAMLWRQSLLYPRAAPHQAFNPPKHPNPRNTVLGVKIPQRNASGRKTAVGPLTPAGLVLQLSTSIVSVDAYSGRQLWSREGYDEHVRLAHQGTELAIVNPSLGRVEVVDCRDGALLRQHAYRGDWQHWFSCGAMVVDFQEKQTPGERDLGILSQSTMRPVLRIWNAITGKEFMPPLDLPRGSRANVCDGRYLVVLEPESTLHYFDLLSGDYFQSEVAVEEDLLGLFVERFGNTLVVCSDAKKTDRQNRILNMSDMSRDFKSVNGYVYAIDTQRQELLWERPGRLSGMYFPNTQPRNSPFMVSYRINPVRVVGVDRNRPNPMFATLAVVDLRSGRLAYSNNNVKLFSPSGFAMLLRPRLQSLEVSIGGTHFIFQSTQDPRPPQPVFNFGYLYLDRTMKRSVDALNYFR